MYTVQLQAVSVFGSTVIGSATIGQVEKLCGNVSYNDIAVFNEQAERSESLCEETRLRRLGVSQIVRTGELLEEEILEIPYGRLTSASQLIKKV